MELGPELCSVVIVHCHGFTPSQLVDHLQDLPACSVLSNVNKVGQSQRSQAGAA